MSIQLEESWKKVLESEFEKDYMKNLKNFLQQEKDSGQLIYPQGSLIFNAFNHTPFQKVKVVILGQDPYHGQDQAHGLSFSVKKGIAIPPSLKNIYKELETDIPGFSAPSHGELTKWADQGVLLLNATLTVRAHQAGSHQQKGWEEFTDQVIRELSRERSNIVFILWGKYAQSKEGLIDSKKHYILKAAHPSPFSAYNGFFGSRHFSKTNVFLQEKGLTPINWQVD